MAKVHNGRVPPSGAGSGWRGAGGKAASGPCRAGPITVPFTGTGKKTPGGACTGTGSVQYRWASGLVARVCVCAFVGREGCAGRMVVTATRFVYNLCDPSMDDAKDASAVTNCAAPSSCRRASTSPRVGNSEVIWFVTLQLRAARRVRLYFSASSCSCAAEYSV